jgi:hypothetical protein
MNKHGKQNVNAAQQKEPFRAMSLS